MQILGFGKLGADWVETVGGNMTGVRSLTSHPDAGCAHRKAHVKQDCPSVANNSCDTAGGSGPGVSQWKGQGKSEGKGSKGKKGKSSGNGANTTAPTQESDAKSGESMPEVKSMQTEDAKSAASTEAGSGKGGQEELMTEVTSLLKAIRLDRAQLKVCQIKKMMPEDEMRTLIDEVRPIA